jgi:cytochrome c-type biogenesis protein CcmH/NrfF
MRRLILLLALLASVAAAAAAPAAQAAPPTLPDIEDEVMCPTCNTALNVAASPQADEQRDFIRSLIAQGKSKAEIKEALAAEYGRDALAVPKAEGFNVAATVVPIGVGVSALVLLALILPRWRRRSRATPSTPAPAGPALSAADAARLDEELRRFDR